MRWCDVAGPPGVGKSTLCDPLWGPHDVEPREIKPPIEWHDFCNEVSRLLGLVREHKSFVAAVRMNRRSMRKMASVSAMESGKPYIQTGFVQRGLGFGWRLVDMGKPVEELYHFFRLMPVSLGVVFLETDADALVERNVAREKVKETAHENRSFMGPLMQPAIEFARNVLDDRGVPVKVISTTGNIDIARKELIDFSKEREEELGHANAPAMRPKYLEPRQPAQTGLGGQVEAVQSAPVWW
jgi:hypothetical protein